MSEPRADHVSISIDQELTSLSRATFKPYIFRVSDGLRSLNEKAYEPEIVAIGPYHHGKVNLQMMEDHKLRYLQQLLHRRKESSVDRYVVALRELEKRARQCYGESIHLNEDEFMKMMLLDGCFIIELFRKFKRRYLIDQNDPILYLDQLTDALRRDLVLFENQVPFFILVELFNMSTFMVLDPPEQIIDLALNFLEGILPIVVPDTKGISVDNVDHLLGLLHSRCCPPSNEIGSDTTDRNEEWEFIKCATELREAGIKFEMREEWTSLFDIKYEKGVLKIPPLTISDETETFFRNQIAYEQYRPITTYSRDVTNYAFFMDSLINSANDVEKLRQYKVINNGLGDDKAVSTMFNKLCVNVAISFPYQSSYFQVYKEVNKHCAKRRNIWLANLNRNYLSSPWKIISIFAAVILLLLTLIQTIFSVLSYFRQK